MPQTQPLVPDMPEHTLTGNIHRHSHFESRLLRTRRDILVYLPRGYRRQQRARYPVLYMQDGQNLFFPEEAFASDWKVDRTVGLLDTMGAVAEFIEFIRSADDNRKDAKARCKIRCSIVRSSR